LESSNLIAGKYPVFLTLDSIKMISTSSSSPLITVINSPIITSVNVVFSNDMDKQEVTEVIIQGFGFTGQLNIPQCVYSMMSSSTSDIEKVETTLLSDSFLSCSSPSVNFMASLIVSQMGKTFVSIEIDNGLIRSDPFVFFFGDLAPKFLHDLQLGQNVLKVEDQEDPYASLFVTGYSPRTAKVSSTVLFVIKGSGFSSLFTWQCVSSLESVLASVSSSSELTCILETPSMLNISFGFKVISSNSSFSSNILPVSLINPPVVWSVDTTEYIESSDSVISIQGDRFLQLRRPDKSLVCAFQGINLTTSASVLSNSELVCSLPNSLIPGEIHVSILSDDISLDINFKVNIRPLSSSVKKHQKEEKLDLLPTLFPIVSPMITHFKGQTELKLSGGHISFALNASKTLGCLFAESVIQPAKEDLNSESSAILCLTPRMKDLPQGLVIPVAFGLFITSVTVVDAISRQPLWHKPIQITYVPDFSIHSVTPTSISQSHSQIEASTIPITVYADLFAPFPQLEMINFVCVFFFASKTQLVPAKRLNSQAIQCLVPLSPLENVPQGRVEVGVSVNNGTDIIRNTTFPVWLEYLSEFSTLINSSVTLSSVLPPQLVELQGSNLDLLTYVNASCIFSFVLNDQHIFNISSSLVVQSSTKAECLTPSWSELVSQTTSSFQIQTPLKGHLTLSSHASLEWIIHCPLVV
jgi:hypothetical protein